VELQQHVDAFEQAGIGIVVVTYDAPELQQAFVEDEGITYPFISDIDTTTMVALGILNEDHQPGDRTYGIPHPGIFVLNPQHEIVGKIFVESYRIRVDGEGVLNYAVQVLE
jgi:peroxiredoxin